MKASRFILTGLALGAGIAATACAPTRAPVALNSRTADYACGADRYGNAPDIMTYDPRSRAETRITSTDGNTVVATGPRYGDPRDWKAAGVRAGVRDSDARHDVPAERYVCTGDGPYDVKLVQGGPNPVLVGAVAGAIVGSAVTQNSEGTRQGAVIGATMGSTLSAHESNAISAGAVAGALIGGANGDTQGAATGAVAGAIIGAEANDKQKDGWHWPRRHRVSDD